MPRLPKKKTTRKPAAVRAFVPDAQVWATALELAGGDPKRLKPISQTEVLVVNGKH